jgi:Domain of unknown function (DUF222)
MRFDPAGKRVPGERTENRYVEIAPTDAGLAAIWAQLQATDGVALDQKLDALAMTVCAADPRTKQQRRADAFGNLAAGLPAMRCLCESPGCPAAQRRPATNVVIHVMAEQATISGDSQSPGHLTNFGPIAAKILRDIAATAKIKPLVIPRTVLSVVIGLRRRWPNSFAVGTRLVDSPDAINQPRFATSTTPSRFRSALRIPRILSCSAAITIW